MSDSRAFKAIGWTAATAVAAVVALAVIVAAWQRNPRTEPARPGTDPAPLHFLAASVDEDFPPTQHPWEFEFPADHGGHRRYRTEWWHVSGTLTDENGNLLALQLLVLRIGLRARPHEHPSRWATSDVYAGLWSVSDPFADGIHTASRLARAALDLAGTAADPTRLWVEDWRLEGIGAARRALDLRVRVAGDGLGLDAALRNVQPLLDSNDIGGRGVDETPPFQFYVQPSLSVDGTLRAGERRTAVRGTASMEHAWGELPLPGGPVARDRFTLHLDDGRVLHGVRTHRPDGSGTPRTTGLLIDRNASAEVLSNDDMELVPIDHWTSPATGARYPIRWRLRSAGAGIDWELVPARANQEGLVWTPFWAGAVRLRDPSATTIGRGFVLLNGYEGRE